MKLLLMVLALVLVLEVQANRQELVELVSFSPCDTPILYHLGTVDPRFKISQQSLLSDIDAAGQIWATVHGSPLFVFDPEKGLTINLVYDERQSLSGQINSLAARLKSENGPLTQKFEEYEARVIDFKKRLEDLNSQIDYWNNRGGAPQDIYDRLISQQSDLKNLASQLNNLAKSLNLSAQKYNINVSTFNQTLASFQEVLEAKPEEGLYKSKENTIDIYLTQSHDELVHTLAHELGHALSLSHNQNRDSIMYQMTSETLKPTDEDIANLTDVCKKRNVLEVLRDRLRERGLF